MNHPIACLAVVTMVLGGCKAAGEGSLTGPSPVAPTPQGCSGSVVERVLVYFNAGATSPNDPAVGFSAQLFGEAVSGLLPQGQNQNVTRNVVPCDYVITGQMQGRTLQVGFGTDRGSGPGGVERGSIVVEQGPNPELVVPNLGGPRPQCAVNLNEPLPALAPPFNFRIRFRVTAGANACGT